MPMITKVCTLCGERKLIEAFSKRGQCRKCFCKINRKYRDHLSDLYVRDKLVQQGISKEFIKENLSILEVKRQLISLKRTIWQISKK